jgi:hypothetical protein
MLLITNKYIGIVDGLDTWEVYLDGELIGTNQSAPDTITETEQPTE